jgi:hypothetical protein
MNLPDSFYIALCMTVLLLGVVYWFWSQNQYLLRKINLLENIVYELKTVCSRPPPSPLEPATYPPAPSSVVEEEELHEELLEEEEAAAPPAAPPAPAPAHAPADDLQPGGVGSGIEELPESINMLEGMTVKELRRLAEQRGIKGSAELKKKDLLSELKRAIPTPSVLAAFQDSAEEPLVEADVVELSSA